ncbi:unnamed protein product [Caenorhabditis nigoni]
MTQSSKVDVIVMVPHDDPTIFLCSRITGISPPGPPTPMVMDDHYGTFVILSDGTSLFFFMTSLKAFGLNQ